MSKEKKTEELNELELSTSSQEQSKIDEESNKKKEGYPYVVFLIIVNEFCERFSYYGLRTVLYIYFTRFINLQKDTATAFYHAYTTVCYFTPILGAVIADGYIGLYATILSLSIVYLIGEIVVTLTSITPLGAPNIYGPIIGLLIIAIGTGGIKPCVGAFGGNQFKPTQKRYLENFFSIFYLSINIGSTIGTILTPIFRSDVKCFGNDCYPLAFGVPAVFMAIAIIIFFSGTKFYNRQRVKSGKNVIVQTFGCIFSGIRNKIKYRKEIKKNHWLDYAEESNYEKSLISDVKAFTRVFFVFIPLPIFWTLYEQQGSRWTDQAQQLSGRIGQSFTIKPDQFQAINPIFIVVLVPLFDFVIYPLFAKVNLLKKQLQRIIVGLILACVSFGIAAVLESQMQKASASLNLPNQVKAINLAPCDLTLNFNLTNMRKIELEQANYLKNKEYKLPKDLLDILSKEKQISFELVHNCPSSITVSQTNYVLTSNELPKSLIFHVDESSRQLTLTTYSYSTKKPLIGVSEIKFVSTLTRNESLFNIRPEISFSAIKYKEFTVENLTLSSSDKLVGYEQIDYANYKLKVTLPVVGEKEQEVLLNSENVLIEICGRYTIILFLNEKENKLDYVLLTDIYPNGIHIGWQLIQIFVMTLAEIMFSISGVSFAYSQAPQSMKSVLQALWFMTVAFGNLIVVIVAEARLISDQVYEYVFFAGLLGLATAIFVLLSWNYKYVEDEVNVNENVNENEKNKKKMNSVSPIDEPEYENTKVLDFKTDQDNKEVRF